MKSIFQRSLLCACLLCATKMSVWAQNAPAQEQAPEPASSTVPKLPPPPVVRNEPNINDGGGLSIEPFYWMTTVQPVLRGGLQFIDLTPGDLQYASSSKATPGVIVSVPVNKNSDIRFTYFQLKAAGNTTAPKDLTLFSFPYPKGTYLATNFIEKDYKLSYEYVTYYWGSGISRLKLKTLWQLQYVTLDSTTDAPLLPNQTDASGAPLQNAGEGTYKTLYPTLGLGLAQTVNRHIRWEANVSGMTYPHRSTMGDADAELAVRFGHVEVIGGGKAFHYRSSPRNAEYLHSTAFGAYVGLRLYWQ